MNGIGSADRKGAKQKKAKGRIRRGKAAGLPRNEARAEKGSPHLQQQQHGEAVIFGRARTYTHRTHKRSVAYMRKANCVPRPALHICTTLRHVRNLRGVARFGPEQK